MSSNPASAAPWIHNGVNVPAYLDIPQGTNRCPYSGLRRGMIFRLIRPRKGRDADGNVIDLPPYVESAKLTPGLRGKRVVNSRSLFAHLILLEKEEAAQISFIPEDAYEEPLTEELRKKNSKPA